MQARSALFDLYGDHLRPRGGRAPVAALVRLLAPLGIAAAGRAHRGLPDGAPGLAATRCGWPPDRATRSPRRPPAGSTRRPPGSTAPAGSAGTAGSTCSCSRPPTGRRDRAAARRQPDLPRLRHARRAHLGRHPARRGGRRAARRGRRPLRAVHRRATPPAPPGAMALVRRAWDLAEIGRGVRAVRRRAAAAAGRGRPRAAPTRRRTRPGSGSCTPGVRFLFRDPQLPAGAAARAAGPAPRAAASSTGTRPGCGRPPTGTSSTASTPATASTDRRVVMTRDRAAARRPHRRASSRSR